MIENLLITVLAIVAIVVISSLPLYLAVKAFGGRTTILSTFVVMLGVGLLSAIIQIVFPFGNIISFIVLLLIFRNVFHLGWLRAFLVWILWLVFVAIFVFIFTLLGIGFLTVSLL